MSATSFPQSTGLIAGEKIFFSSTANFIQSALTESLPPHIRACISLQANGGPKGGQKLETSANSTNSSGDPAILTSHYLATDKNYGCMR